MEWSASMISGIIRKNNDDYIFKINRYISYVDIEKANNMSKEDVELIKTEEEKIEMLSFLKSNNIPITNNSLRDITTRYLSGNKDKSKQATKQ